MTYTATGDLIPRQSNLDLHDAITHALQDIVQWKNETPRPRSRSSSARPLSSMMAQARDSQLPLGRIRSQTLSYASELDDWFAKATSDTPGPASPSPITLKITGPLKSILRGTQEERSSPGIGNKVTFNVPSMDSRGFLAAIAFSWGVPQGKMGLGGLDTSTSSSTISESPSSESVGSFPCSTSDLSILPTSVRDSVDVSILRARAAALRRLEAHEASDSDSDVDVRSSGSTLSVASIDMDDEDNETLYECRQRLWRNRCEEAKDRALAEGFGAWDHVAELCEALVKGEAQNIDVFEALFVCAFGEASAQTVDIAERSNNANARFAPQGQTYDDDTTPNRKHGEQKGIREVIKAMGVKFKSVLKKSDAVVSPIPRAAPSPVQLEL